MSLLIIIPAFLVTIGVLVTVHEFGHFWVARKLGVKVLRFSVGFGKPLLKRVSKDADKIEYVVSALPFGGYVKMLDERECEEGCTIDPIDLPRAFNRQPVWKRAAIVLAGPVANFILAILIYALVAMLGQDVRYAYIEVLPDTPAANAGFQSGDLITAINDNVVTSMDEVPLRLMDEYLQDPAHINVSVKTQEGDNLQHSLNLADTSLLKGKVDILEKIGMDIWYPPYDLVVADIASNSAAQQAGLLKGDKVISFDNQSANNIDKFIQYIKSHANSPVALKVERNGSTSIINVTPRRIDENKVQIGVAFKAPVELKDKLFFKQSFGPVDALYRGIDKTWRTSALSLKLLGRMILGEVSINNISGPVTIAQFAGETAAMGLVTFLTFLAFVSVSLGVLNLLPIPMLDGGHLLYYLIEVVKGSPVSADVEAVGLKIGMAFIAGLMMLALYNDLMRLMN